MFADGLQSKSRPKPGCVRKYDKMNYCTFCEKGMKAKISRHLSSVHKDEQRVASILKMEKQSVRGKKYDAGNACQ